MMKEILTGNNAKHKQWNELTQVDEIAGLMKASRERLQLVYKHSFTCGICRMALENIENSFDKLEEKADMHFVDVKNARPVSKLLAEQLDVRHESPQVIIIGNEEVVWHDSHHSIKVDAMLEVLINAH